MPALEGPLFVEAMVVRLDSHSSSDDQTKYRDPKNMEEARQALEQLSKDLPSLAERQQQARRDVERLKREQDDIARKAEQAAKETNSEKKLAELAKKQAAVADELSKLDTPNQEARRDKAEQAATKALGLR